MTFAQSFGAVLIGGSKAIVRLAAQPHEPVTGPLDVEHTRCPLVECSARLTARLVPDPRSIGKSTAYVLGPMFFATFGREPFGTMSEIMISSFWGHDGIDGLTSQDQIGTICIHLAVLEQRALHVSVDEVVIELQHAHLGVLQNEESHVYGQSVRDGFFVHLYLVHIVNDDVELSEPPIVAHERCRLLCTVVDVTMIVFP